MRPKKKPTHVLIDQVRITREGGDAIIDHADANVAGARFFVGPRIASMSDVDIVDMHNEILDAQSHRQDTRTEQVEPMTRDQALELYRPIRASVRRILRAAVRACDQSDLMRAAKLLRFWAHGKIVLPEGDEAAEMLADIALFEPNQRGRGAFDVFLGGKALQLDAADFELAQRMANAFFSLFRCTARHEVAGVWLEDLLEGNRRVWLMDESMESSASTNSAFGMRVFAAGDFHVGFGIAVPSDDETTQFSVQGVTRNGRTPFRHSLALTLYRDSLSGRAALSPEAEDVFRSLLARLVESGSGSHRGVSAGQTSQRVRTRKRK
jgi:hypothetical protein